MTHEETMRAELKPCTNPTHDFKFLGRFGQWQWAEDYWLSRSFNDTTVHRMYFQLHEVVSDDIRCWNLVIGKLNLYLVRKDKK